MPTLIPPDEVFQTPPRPLAETQGAYTIPDFVDLTFTVKEGMVANYLNHPFPRKGLQYTEATEANNHIKKIIVALMSSIAHPTKILENFARVADYSYRNHYLQRRFYCKFSREIWKLTYLFLRRLGTNHNLAYRWGRIVATVFQYEEGYRTRLQDLFSETTKSALLKRKELKRLLNLYLQREKTGGAYVEATDQKFISAFKILSLALLIPKVKAAWKFAWHEMDIENLQLDDADRYWSNMNADYDFEGKDINLRFGLAVDTYNWYQINKWKKSLKNVAT